jgi:Gluconate 2-dehydrogenase subunit 3
MNRRWTRRRFLETGLKGSIVVGSGVAAGTLRATVPVAEGQTRLALSGLAQAERDLLRAAMDQIIPAGDGMPAASAVGGVDYLDRLASQASAIRAELEKSLAALQELSSKQLGKDFTALSQEDQLGTLKKLEKQQPETLASLRDYVYESYYTQPQVWKLIGYEFYPTNAAGPKMKPFDESVLAKVKQMPKLYREVT